MELLEKKLRLPSAHWHTCTCSWQLDMKFFLVWSSIFRSIEKQSPQLKSWNTSCRQIILMLPIILSLFMLQQTMALLYLTVCVTSSQNHMKYIIHLAFFKIFNYTLLQCTMNSINKHLIASCVYLTSSN